jgi:hypothetical protein
MKENSDFFFGIHPGRVSPQALNEWGSFFPGLTKEGLTLVAKKKSTIQPSVGRNEPVRCRASQRKNPTEGGHGKRPKKEYEQRSTLDVHSEGHVEIRLGL